MTPDHGPAPTSESPTLETVQVTFYLCPHCKKRHGVEAQARDCCMCETCGVVKGAKHASFHFECNGCHRKRAVSSAQGYLSRAKKKLAETEEQLAHWRTEIAKHETELAAAKALPTNRSGGES